MEDFSSIIAQGVHALAQPLTVMRLALLSCADRDLNETDCGIYVRLATGQLENVSSIFGYLQQFIAANQNAVDYASHNLWMLLESIIENQSPLFQESGVNLEVDIDNVLPATLLDMDRTVQAVLAILSAVKSISAKGDVVRLHVARHQDHIHLEVLNRSATSKQLGMTERLALTLAKLNILAQEGEYHQQEEPFCVSLKLAFHSEPSDNSFEPLRRIEIV